VGFELTDAMLKQGTALEQETEEEAKREQEGSDTCINWDKRGQEN
jgi:hypothetical protein